PHTVFVDIHLIKPGPWLLVPGCWSLVTRTRDQGLATRDLPLWNQHHAPERLPAFDERMSRRRFGEREGPIDDNLQCPAGDVFEGRLDQGVPARMFQPLPGPKKDAGQRLFPRAQLIGIGHERVAARRADVADATAIRRRRDAALECPPAD